MLWFIDQTETLEMMQRLRSADEAKTRFLMKVSHELRTPMHTILGMNEVIAEETSEEKIRGYTREIASAGDSMIALIEEVLDASPVRKWYASDKEGCICFRRGYP